MKNTSGRTTHWRSIAESKKSSEFLNRHDGEFPKGLFEHQESALSRRKFMGLMGASAALAGAGSLTGCVRKEQQHVYPYTNRPEQLVPGEPVFFRTATHVGGRVLGLHVESQDMRPTKIEGNPDHPMNNPQRKAHGSQLVPHRLGGTSSWVQASILGLYDPDRSGGFSFAGKISKEAKERAVVLSGAALAGDWAKLAAVLDEVLSKKDGKIAILAEATPSPTLESLFVRAQKSHPGIKFYRHDVAYESTTRSSFEAIFGEGTEPVYNMDRPEILLSIDSNMLGDEGDSVRNARLFADGRRNPEKRMSRLFHVGPILNVTAVTADEQLRLPASQSGPFLAAVARVLLEKKAISAGNAAEIQKIISRAPAPNVDLGSITLSEGKRPKVEAWIEAVAEDLATHAKKSLVFVGERQPAWVHAVGWLINTGLGNVGPKAPVEVYQHPKNSVKWEGIEALKANASSVEALFIIGGNPAQNAPVDLAFSKIIQGVKNSFHFSDHINETSALTSYHIPRSHFLEAWGDWRAADGTVSIQQPLISPLFQSLSDVELISALAATPGLELEASLIAIAQPHNRDAGFSSVRNKWARLGLNAWKESLFKGLLFKNTIADLAKGKEIVLAREARSLSSVKTSWSDPLLSAGVPSELKPPSIDALEINFIIDPSVCDGRFANNAWLQELPDPISKLTWDNAAYISYKTAQDLGLSSRPVADVHVGDWSTLGLGSESVEIAVMVIPGMADNVVAVGLGYGRRRGGQVALGGNLAANDAETAKYNDAGGSDLFPIRSTKALWFATGGSLKGATREGSSVYPLATTQEHWYIDAGFRREHVQEFRREFWLSEFKKGREGLSHGHGIGKLYEENYKDELFGTSIIIPDDSSSVFDKETHNDKPTGQAVPQWGMVIDLNTCTGCSACVVACQAENNIPVVGKERVLNGREMHWIRIDRYFRGEDPADPDVIMVQPMACGHCEAAPCETVCPVAATVHSPEGTNDMVYNRCVGTRYCSNNCQYKVRRFNFFNYQRENKEANELGRMQKNPDVSIRFRGVMEKCTYCIQRVMGAKIATKRQFGRGPKVRVPDGAAVPACAQVCPSSAIVFGDIADKTSVVHALKQHPRNYSVLAELNNRPRTTYLARVRNLHPTLHPMKEESHDGPAHH